MEKIIGLVVAALLLVLVGNAAIKILMGRDIKKIEAEFDKRSVRDVVILVPPEDKRSDEEILKEFNMDGVEDRKITKVVRMTGPVSITSGIAGVGGHGGQTKNQSTN